MYIDLDLSTGCPNLDNTSSTATLPGGLMLPRTNAFSIQQLLYDIVDAGK